MVFFAILLSKGLVSKKTRQSFVDRRGARRGFGVLAGLSLELETEHSNRNADAYQSPSE
jgi:hypothetical protein